MNIPNGDGYYQGPPGQQQQQQFHALPDDDDDINEYLRWLRPAATTTSMHRRPARLAGEGRVAVHDDGPVLPRAGAGCPGAECERGAQLQLVFRERF